MGRIPSNMTEVLFISGHGTEYIQTDIHLDNECIVKSRWMFNNDAACIYGCFTSSAHTDNFCLYGGSHSSDSYIRFNGQLVRAFRPVSGTTYSFEHSADGFFVDGTKITGFQPATFTCSSALRIFGLPNSRYEPIKGRCYNFQILKKTTPAGDLLPEETVVLYDFVPVKNEDTGEVGLYETVNGRFYGNSGTGAFVASTTIIERPIPGKISAFRRRLMEAACKHYEPEPGYDGKVWAYFNVNESGKDNRTIVYATYGITAIEVNGEPIPLATTYNFPSAGRYLLKYTLQGGTRYVSNMFRGVAVNEVYLPTDGRIVLEASNQFFYNSNWLEKVRGKTSQMLRFYSTTAARALYSSTADIELTGVTNFGSVVNGNNIHRFCVKGTFSSMPNSSITGYGAASNFRDVWIESPNLTSIGTYFCRNMQNLERVVMNVPTPPTLGSNPFNTTNNTFKIYVPYSADHSILDAYKAASGWSTYAARMYELNPDGTIPV